VIEFNHTVAAPVDINSVYAALNDPQILAQCIPGCDYINRLSDEQMEATLTLKLGFMRARFAGNLKVVEIDPPRRYTLAFSSQSSRSSEVQGQADMTLLSRSDNSTEIHYAVTAQVNGNVAKLGTRIITSTTHTMIRQFFKNLNIYLSKQKRLR